MIKEKKAQKDTIVTSTKDYELRLKDTLWLARELEKAWAALEFYADKRNWEASFVNEYDILGEPGYVHGDHGKRAREALDD